MILLFFRLHARIANSLTPQPMAFAANAEHRSKILHTYTDKLNRIATILEVLEFIDLIDSIVLVNNKLDIV